MYRTDPTHRFERDAFAKAVITPDGDAAVRLRWSGVEVEAEAWGPGANWALELVPSWLGTEDNLAGFEPEADARIARLWRDHGDFRLCRSPVVWQELLLVILGQRVASNEATKSWRAMCERWGRPAPGPDGLAMPPTPVALRSLDYSELHTVGVERRRAEAVLLAARRANRLEEAATMPVGAAIERLSALPGLGAWTATATVGVTHGDPDVVLLGDYGMPTLANYFFTGDPKRLPPEPDGDRIMIEHLAPWRGHRQRVMRLLMAAPIKVPRRGPRAFNPDIRRL